MAMETFYYLHSAIYIRECKKWSRLNVKEMDQMWRHHHRHVIVISLSSFPFRRNESAHANGKGHFARPTFIIVIPTRPACLAFLYCKKRR